MKRCSSCQTPYPDEFAFCPLDGAELDDPGAYAVGTTIRNKYRILAKVGKGGMGHVYKALHLVFNEVRALKVMHPSLKTQKEFVQRFQREAFVARRLRHPNAVEVDDVDETEDGRQIIVMEFIDGRILRDVLRREAPLTVKRACSIARQVAAALGAAHQLGIIHRDIKPENIALVKSSRGELVKVLDFGITKLREGQLKDEAGALSLSGAATFAAIGTPEYMSPEQVRQHEPDGRSDLYSLGIVFYEMLTGRLPLEAESQAEWFLAQVGQAPRPLHETAPDLRIPPRLTDLVMAMLEKDCANRPADAASVMAVIDACAEEIDALTPMSPRAASPARGAPSADATTVPAYFEGWKTGSLIAERYKVLEKIADARMGPIYTVMDSGSGDVSVLKLITPWNQPSPEIVNGLNEYCRRMQRLEHPNVVRTLELGQAEDGVLFISTEYLSGPNLREVMEADAPLELSRACQIVGEVASALDAGLQLEMTHGEIKPEHILMARISRTEQTKLLDFSLDRLKETLPELSDADIPAEWLAPLHYMAPERVSGLTYLPQSDIYSLGIVFYEMLTGRRPFAGSGIEIAFKQVQELPVPVEVVRPELNISPRVARLVMRMIEKDPEARPANGRALLEELSAL
jgi:serine/threonine protein kinase